MPMAAISKKKSKSNNENIYYSETKRVRSTINYRLSNEDKAIELKNNEKIATVQNPSFFIHDNRLKIVIPLSSMCRRQSKNLFDANFFGFLAMNTSRF